MAISLYEIYGKYFKIVYIERLVSRLKDKPLIHEDEYYYSIIRKNIKRIRLEKNLTQQNLADMINMSREYICDIENESRSKHPTIAVIGRIADALEIDISDIFHE